MKTPIAHFLLLTLSLALLLTPLAALALAAQIGSAQIGHRAGISVLEKEKVSQVLAYLHTDLEFLEGNFINEFSYQRFGGTSGKVARLAHLLEEADVWRVQIQFRDFGEQESACTLDQDASSNTLRLLINSGREDFLLKDFAPFLPKPSLTALPDTAPNPSDPTEK